VRTASEEVWCSSLADVTVGDYRLVEFIGAGKIGFVYKAQLDKFPGVSRAIKLIFGDLKQGWENELLKVMQLQVVDGVVHYHSTGTALISHGSKTKTCMYTVWDYIAPGQDLKRYLSRVKKIPVTFIVAVVERILHVLHECEHNGVVRHGDLHAGNILIGNDSNARLDDQLMRREPVYVSDFGYGTTGGVVQPKDDYAGLAQIFNQMVQHVEYETATPTERQLLEAIKGDFGKLLREPDGPERRGPYELLRMLNELKQSIQVGERRFERSSSSATAVVGASDASSVGQFQVSEMIGNRWDWWRRLFVPSVPSHSKILALDIPTVVTGPRGCGKTMFFRRLSERLIVECGEIPELPSARRFVALYVNANDVADAFAHFPESPSAEDERRITCYANLCILADLLTVQSARAGRKEPATDKLLSLVQKWLVPDAFNPLVIGEDRLERYRAVLEQTKWLFGKQGQGKQFPGYQDMSQHRWLPELIRQARDCCPWIGDRTVLLFVDDFSTPRVSMSMQKALNRLLLQRSSEFLAKVATEARSTFFPEDSSGKILQDGDDYQFVDMGEESLFLPDRQRLAFLEEVFDRRLKIDPRMPQGNVSLRGLLGKEKHSKTEFARRLRMSLEGKSIPDQPPISGASQRRGRSRHRVLYYGDNVFSSLWSGDTRTMIQLISDVFDQAAQVSSSTQQISIPVDPAIQDRAFRDRGGEWLSSHSRNEPTDLQKMRAGLAEARHAESGYALCGTYGSHLKAIVEAFVDAATKLLIGPTYKMFENGKMREVPRMAFRLEIIDEFRLTGLAEEIYRDLIRYGLFMVDNRGKSVRGTFVPRLYLRRLLLPYCTLALSKRDSVSLTCDQFRHLLLKPDVFKISALRKQSAGNQLEFFESNLTREPESEYDDLGND
jgi:serine/threonine protein kinase